MMKNIKKLLLVILCLVLVSTLFGSCKGNKKTNSDIEINYSTADINFVNAEGEANFRVVRSTEDNGVAQYVPVIIKAIKEKFDVSIKNVTDTEPKGDFSEIVIGESNREITAKARQALKLESTGRKDDYIICSIGDDIAIYGLSVEATVAAVEYFARTYITGETVVGGIHYVYSSSNKYEDLNIAGTTRLSDFTLVRPIYNVSYITQLQTEELLKTIESKTGYCISQVYDNIASKTGNNTDGSGTLTPTEPTEYEIIIGNATRSDVKSIKEHDVYEIRIENKKVYLNGGSPYATAMAVSEFKKMVENNTVISADMSVTNGNYNSVIGSYDTATYYRPTWYDEFDGEDIDYSKWHVVWDTLVNAYSTPDGKSMYRGSTVLKNNYVKDGYLYQVAREVGNEYYGGFFDTQKIMQYKYGYIETSTLNPKGMGFWTSLWTGSTPEFYPEYRDDYYFSETDVNECYGPGTWVYGNTFAWPTAAAKAALGIPSDEAGCIFYGNTKNSDDDRGFWMDFHTYGYEWLDNMQISFMCDGEVYAQRTLREGAEQVAYAQPQEIRLSLSTGSDNNGTPTTDPNEWAQTNKFISDYVYLYQVDGQQILKWDAAATTYK